MDSLAFTKASIIGIFLDIAMANEAFAQTTFSCSVDAFPFNTSINILDDDSTSFPPDILLDSIS
jgi:hypothetical protein